jgi:hypothetical protein
MPTGSGYFTSDGRPRSSLDISTQLGGSRSQDEQPAGWRFTNWPECAEASLAWVPSGGGTATSAVVARARAERDAGREAPSHPVGAWRASREGGVYFDVARQLDGAPAPPG